MSFSPEEMARAQAILENVRDGWLSRPNVTAVDLGFKWSQGSMTGQLAIRVHIQQKKPLSELSEEELFPNEIDGVLVDVVEATYGVQSLDNQLTAEGDAQSEAGAASGYGDRLEPIPVGVSIGSRHITAGTLGAKVVDIETEREMILSNWHILAAVENPEENLAIRQPGMADGGGSNDNFAQLSRHVLGPFDAAVARITGEREVLWETLEGDAIVEAGTPQLGMMVWKSGRTTGRTEGFIDGVHMSVSITYRVGTRPLQQVCRIVPRPGAGNVEISMGGDSGSVWVDEATGKAVGLHFAGEVGNRPEQALAHDINPVLEHLNVRFVNDVPEPDPVPDPPPVDDPVDPPPAPERSFWQIIWDFILSLFG